MFSLFSSLYSFLVSSVPFFFHFFCPLNPARSLEREREKERERERALERIFKSILAFSGVDTRCRSVSVEQNLKTQANAVVFA